MGPGAWDVAAGVMMRQLLTVLLVHAPELKVAIALVGVVELVSIRDFGHQRTRIFSQRMEKDSVNDEAENLQCAKQAASAICVPNMRTTTNPESRCACYC
jgi:hypothetical protein